MSSHRSSRPRANTIASVLAKAIAMELLGRFVKSPYETVTRRAALGVFAALSSERLRELFAALSPENRARAVLALNLAIDALHKTDAVERRLIDVLSALRGRVVST